VFEQLTAQLDGEISDDGRHRVAKGLTELKKRARTVKELVENSRFYVEPPRYPLTDAKAAKLLNEETSSLLLRAKETLATVEDWSSSSLEEKLRSLAEDMDIGLGKIAQPMRAAVTGMNVSPGIFEVIEILGRNETLTRIDRAAERTN
jgi:glutamyl-tRNA synthetase